MVVVVAAMVFVSVLIMNVGLCYIVTALISDLELNLFQLDVMIGEKTAQERLEYNRKLGNIIQFHAEAKE